MAVRMCRVLARSHSRPQRPRSFWSAPRIATSGLVQRHSGIEWLCKHNRLRPEPIRFIRLDSEHAQSDGKFVNRGLPVMDMARGSTAVKRVRMLKPRARDRARVGMDCTIAIETSKRQNGGRFKFHGMCFISRG